VTQRAGVVRQLWDAASGHVTMSELLCAAMIMRPVCHHACQADRQAESMQGLLLRNPFQVVTQRRVGQHTNKRVVAKTVNRYCKREENSSYSLPFRKEYTIR